MRPITGTPPQVIVFDLDDTLVDTSRIFFDARESFIALVKQEGYAESTARDLFNHIDHRNLHRLGYVSERNLISMRETYETLVHQTGNRISQRFVPKTLQQIARIGSRCLYVLPRPLPCAKWLVGWCAKRFRLALLTRGSDALQNAKLDQLNLRHFFEKISIVDRKTPDSFGQLLKSLKCKPQNAVSIGDSPRYDIHTALSTGMQAILVRYPHEKIQWHLEHEEAGSLRKKQYRIADSLRDVPAEILQLRRL